MFFRFTALALALFATQAAQANPLARTTSGLVGSSVGGAVGLPASLPIKSIDSVAAHSNITLPRPFISKNLRIDARQDPVDFFTCGAPDCVSSCNEWGLLVVTPDDCVPVPPFASVAIIQSSSAGLTFEVFVGTEGCTEIAQIPAVNECFNMPPNSGLTFESFGIVLNQ